IEKKKKIREKKKEKKKKKMLICAFAQCSKEYFVVLEMRRHYRGLVCLDQKIDLLIVQFSFHLNNRCNWQDEIIDIGFVLSVCNNKQQINKYVYVYIYTYYYIYNNLNSISNAVIQIEKQLCGIENLQRRRISMTIGKVMEYLQGKQRLDLELYNKKKP
ncbi:hypothetical protein RFI_26699, partial [Reticulomyxa filosa]